MTVAEFKEKLDSYFECGYGECELKTIDQGGNDCEVLSPVCMDYRRGILCYNAYASGS